MVFLVVLVAAVVVLLVVVRAAAVSGDPSRGSSRRPRRAPRPQQGRARPLAPDDDPEFLRELGRQVRRDDGSPA